MLSNKYVSDRKNVIKNIWYICWIENSEELVDLFVDLMEQSFF